MTTPKTRTDPCLAPSASPAPRDTLPDLIEERTDPGGSPGEPASAESACVDDVLRNMKGPRVWSPAAETGAASNGANFAAYHSLGDAAKRRDTPAIIDRVMLDITIPSLPPAMEGAPDGDREGLAAFVEQSLLRVGSTRARRDASTTVVRRPRRRSSLAVFAVTLLALVAIGAAIVWAARAELAGSAAAPAATRRATPAAYAEPSAAIEAAPSPAPSPSPSLDVADAVPKAPPRSARSIPATPPPSAAEPKPDTPKNDLPRSL